MIVEALTRAEADVAAVIAISGFSFRGSEGAMSQKHIHEELARPWTRFFVAKDEKRIVAGYIFFWHVADEAHLMNVAVFPGERRRGVGRALVERLIAYAKESAIVKILLEVRESNVAAITLYRAFGFEEINRRKRYYSDGEDAVEMMLTI